jgi:hypothetical protein
LRKTEAISKVNKEGSGVTSTEGAAKTENGSDMAVTSTKVREKARKSRTRMGFMQQVKPIFERLLGQMELALLEGMEDAVNICQKT